MGSPSGRETPDGRLGQNPDMQTKSGAGDPLAGVRRLCLDLPEVTERVSHGEPAWFVREKKVFIMFDDHHHHDERLGFWCAARPGVQESLVGDSPDRFYRPPYVGHRGWLGVCLDLADVGWEEVDDLVRDAYCMIAPRSLAARVTLGPAKSGHAS